MPAKGILTDRQIASIVRGRPDTVDELAIIVDRAFATRHGESILAAIRSAS